MKPEKIIEFCKNLKRFARGLSPSQQCELAWLMKSGVGVFDGIDADGKMGADFGVRMPFALMWGELLLDYNERIKEPEEK